MSSKKQQSLPATVKPGRGLTVVEFGTGLTPAECLAEAKRMFGPAQLLPSEDRRRYEAIFLNIAEAIRPRDMIELMWVQDLADQVMELRRIRNFKQIIVASAGMRGRARPSEKRYGKLTKLEEAEAFRLRLADLEQINVMEVSLESRRSAVMRDVLYYRGANLDIQARLNRIIDGEYNEVPPVKGEPGSQAA